MTQDLPDQAPANVKDLLPSKSLSALMAVLGDQLMTKGL